MSSHGVNGSTSLLLTPHITWSQSPPQGFGTSFTKFGTLFIKFGTSDPIISRTPIWTWIVHDFILELIRKWLGVDPHLETHLGTLGTSFTKFGTFFIKCGTSNPIVFGAPIWTWMVHDFIFKPIRKWLEADLHLGTHFGMLGTSFTKFGTFFIKCGTSDLIVFGTPIWT